MTVMVMVEILQCPGRVEFRVLTTIDPVRKVNSEQLQDFSEFREDEKFIETIWNRTTMPKRRYALTIQCADNLENSF
jgi:hypothetical protein